MVDRRQANVDIHMRMRMRIYVQLHFGSRGDSPLVFGEGEGRARPLTGL